MGSIQKTFHGIKALGAFIAECKAYWKDLKEVPEEGFPDRKREKRAEHSKNCLDRFGIPYNLPDRETLYKHTPCIFVANHLSFLDALIVSAAFDEDMRILFKSTLLRIPGFRECVAKERFIPVVRGKCAAYNLNIRDKITHAVQEGANLVFFPEGTRSKTGILGPFKMGAFYAAIQHNLPIVPLIIRGTDVALPKKSIQLDPCLCSLEVLDPIYDNLGVEVAEKERVHSLAHRVHKVMESAINLEGDGVLKGAP